MTEDTAQPSAAAAMLAALQGFIAACGGNPPDWLRAEHAAAEDAIALATREGGAPTLAYVVVSTWSDGSPHLEAFRTERLARQALEASIVENYQDADDLPRIAAIRDAALADVRQQSLPVRWTDGCGDFAMSLAVVSVTDGLAAGLLPEGDYTLADGAAWFTAGNASIRIRRGDEGITVDVYRIGAEDAEAIATCWALDSELAPTEEATVTA